ncbi:MAG TPA: hypothetical protein VF800_02920 [Telluria sp.]|jgi:uncharacterized membrane protein
MNVVIMLYLVAATAWTPTVRIEFPMKSMAECIEIVGLSKPATGVTLTCAYKDKNK